MFFRKQSNFLTKAFSFVLLGSFALPNVGVIRAFAGDAYVSSAKVSAMKKYTTDLTGLAHFGRIGGNARYENEVNSLVKILAGGESRQPVILDEKGDNQKSVVELLAARIASGDVPANLKNKRVLELELNSFFSDSTTTAEKSQIFAGIVAELAAAKSETILFVDELTNFVGTSEINDVLTNALLQGKVKIIGGSSKAAYDERVKNNTELAAVFQTIEVSDFSGFNTEESAAARYDENAGFRGDQVSPDLREMMTSDPTGRKRIDVIIQSKDADNQILRAVLAENNVRMQDRIGDSNTILVNLPLSSVEILAQSGLINYMSPDRPTLQAGHVENASGATVVRSQPAVGSRAAYNLDGTGVGIAILDSGILATQKTFSTGSGSGSRIVFSKNFVTSSSTTDDDYGHGTHVAGIAAGNSNSNGGAYRGIASNANIINLKVLDGEGRGQTSWLLNALDWVKLNHRTYNIRVLNLSLGGVAIDTYTNDPVCRKVQELSALGILVVAAAGNEGKKPNGQKLYGHIHSPGNDPSVLTVGAVKTKNTDGRTDDAMATFSSKGPTRSFYTNSSGVRLYDNAIKPDLVAPGNKIVSSRAKQNCYLVTKYPNMTNGFTDSSDGNDNLLAMSGTSMSTPVVAGAAALLFQVNPNLTPQMVKMIFEYTAQPLSGYNMLEQGAGELNIEGAVRLAKAYRTDIDFRSSTVAAGTSLFTGETAFPTVTSTFNGSTIRWSQGILTNHAFLKGAVLANTFHNAYRNGMWFEKGVIHSDSYNFILDGDFSNAASITITPKIIRSNGLTLGEGSVFRAYGVLVTDGVLVSDGVLVTDGVLVSDGTNSADGTLVSDGVLVSDSMLVSDGVLVSDSTNANSTTEDED